jgi:hypothetical protein
MASQSGDKEAIMGTMVYLTADNQLLKSCFLSNNRLLSVKTNYRECALAAHGPIFDAREI